MTEPEQKPSGLDLAREALAEYKKRTWAIPSKNPGPPKPKPRRFVRTGERRDPAPLSGAFSDISTDPRWEAGLAGGSIIDQWTTLCPQYVGLVQPVHYEQQTGRLDLRPSSHSYAAQLRLRGGQLAKQINDKMGKPIVRTIRVLPVGAIQEVAPAAREHTAPEGPVKTRETASPGYRDALAVVLEHKPDKEPTNPYVLEAIARQETALRAGRQPEDELADTDTDVAPQPVRDSVEESLARARAYARTQRTGQQPRRAFDVA